MNELLKKYYKENVRAHMIDDASTHGFRYVNVWIADYDKLPDDCYDWITFVDVPHEYHMWRHEPIKSFFDAVGKADQELEFLANFYKEISKGENWNNHDAFGVQLESFKDAIDMVKYGEYARLDNLGIEK